MSCFREKLGTNLYIPLHVQENLICAWARINRGFCKQDKIGNYFSLSIKGVANEKFRHMQQKWILLRNRQFMKELVRNSKLLSLKSITTVLALIIFL